MAESSRRSAKAIAAAATRDPLATNNADTVVVLPQLPRVLVVSGTYVGNGTTGRHICLRVAWRRTPSYRAASAESP